MLDNFQTVYDKESVTVSCPWIIQYKEFNTEKEECVFTHLSL